MDNKKPTTDRITEDRELGRSVTTVGNSKGTTLPSEWLDKLGDPNETDMEFDLEKRTIQLHF